MTAADHGASTRGAQERIERLSRSVWRIAVPVYTLPPFDHTNAYLIVDAGVAVLVDPGSAESAALDLLDEALRRAGSPRLSQVVITHSHPDHVDGVGPVLARTAEPAVAVHALEADRLPPEWPRALVAEGDTTKVGEVTLSYLHTPGHSPGHLTIVVTEPDGAIIALAGDLVAAEGSVWVGLPDGDMAQYLTSLKRIVATGAGLVGAGHGPAIRSVESRLAEMADHRLERERQVVGALADSSLTARQITEKVYPPLPQPVLELAVKSVEAHLVKLEGEARVRRTDSLVGTSESTYTLA
ncbi:MAG: MBL fold metallo-hydrolase [Trueperaceae bacterium]|nr:MBL fold metallo-hydrolase [Trueperaceae bacterium]